MDVTSAAVGAFGGLYLTRDASPLAYPLGAALAIQQLHDVGFGAWLASRSPSFLRQRPVLDVFTRYAEEVGTTVLVVDAAIVEQGSSSEPALCFPGLRRGDQRVGLPPRTWSSSRPLHASPERADRRLKREARTCVPFGRDNASFFQVCTSRVAHMFEPGHLDRLASKDTAARARLSVFRPLLNQAYRKHAFAFRIHSDETVVDATTNEPVGDASDRLIDTPFGDDFCTSWPSSTRRCGAN